MNQDRDIPHIAMTTDTNPRPRDQPCGEYSESATGPGLCRCGWSLGGHSEADKQKWNPHYGETTEEALARLQVGRES